MRNQIKRYIRQSLLELKPNIDAQTDFLVIAMRLAGILNEDIEVI
ncbi:ribonuclease P [Mycobacteroides abscessus subsp. abscessus]|nr:ribonuclease P [Mycobacteroides abscessus subsp. abscessus]